MMASAGVPRMVVMYPREKHPEEELIRNLFRLENNMLRGWSESLLVGSNLCGAGQLLTLCVCLSSYHCLACVPYNSAKRPVFSTFSIGACI